jgi:hypothetical protein
VLVFCFAIEADILVLSRTHLQVSVYRDCRLPSSKISRETPKESLGISFKLRCSN